MVIRLHGFGVVYLRAYQHNYRIC